MARAKVTMFDVLDLEQLLAAYHALHAHVYGPQSSCKEETCIEVKSSIEWLKNRVLGTGKDGKG